MKKILLSLMFFISISSSAAGCDLLTRNINQKTIITNKEGDIIRNILNKENVLISTSTKDLFKSITQFQNKYKLEAVGNIGPKTKSKINELIINSCKNNSVSTSTMATTSVIVSRFVDTDPERLILSGPNGGESIEQGLGRSLDIVWSSENMSKDSDIVIELLGENLEIVIKQWKVKNTGKFTLDHNQVDGLQIGWFNLRIKHFCNSDIIACSVDTSDNPFVIYPPNGWVAGVFNFNKFDSGKKYYVNYSQSIPVAWFSYAKDFDYYKVYLGNVLLNKEVFVGNTRDAGSSVDYMKLKELKSGTNKTDLEIQNAYYIKVKVAKRANEGEDKVIKEIVSGQFGIR
jgi:hypothetical protein